MFESKKKSKVLCAKRFCVCLLLSINLVIFLAIGRSLRKRPKGKTTNSGMKRQKEKALLHSRGGK